MFDLKTVLVFSSLVSLTLGIPLLMFGLVRRENRLFIWLSLAPFSWGTATFVFSLRPDLDFIWSTTLANGLILFSTIALYEVVRSLAGRRTRASWVGPIMLVIQLALFGFCPLVVESYWLRSLIMCVATCVQFTLVIQALLTGVPAKRGIFHYLFLLPWVLTYVFNLVRLGFILLSMDRNVPHINEPAFSAAMAAYGAMMVWLSLSVVFFVGNQLQIQLIETAGTDPLTGLLNRRALVDAYRRSLSRCRREGLPISLLLADLDHFKRINDTYGHQAGDMVLTDIAELFRRDLRAEDVLARYGGEEFMIVLPGTDSDDASEIAERLRMALQSKTTGHGRHRLTVTASFGVATRQGDYDSFDEISREADEALYRAKAQGRNRVVSYKPGAAAAPHVRSQPVEA